MTADDDIAAAIRDRVLRRTMWLEPGSFDVAVRDGQVEIAGEVDRRSTAGILERLIGALDGVRGVDARLGWTLDDAHLSAPLETEHEPGAASLASRARPLPLHR